MLGVVIGWKNFLVNLTSAAALVLVLVLTSLGQAQAQQFVRIGTGGTTGGYYAVGSAIAQAVSQPGKLIVTTQATHGSVANVHGIASGAMESGFSQSEVAAWAQKGTGLFEGKPIGDLRLITNLYPESIHVVVRRSAGLKNIADLKGKRVGLDETGSGTWITARRVLAAFGLKETDIQPFYIKAPQAADKLKEGALDAFFFVGGAPASTITGLSSSMAIALLPIEGAAAQALHTSIPLWTPDPIPAATYKDVEAVNTLAVTAQWVTSAKVHTDTVYQITKALYTEGQQKSLAQSHAQAKSITLHNAVKDAVIPFHPGAEKFYREAGVLK
jgi:TRAP transporter TAXI family solute receptor